MTNKNYIFEQDESSDAHEPLILFTDRGTVQKVIVLPRDDLQTEELVLEEVEVFRVRPSSLTFCVSRYKFSNCVNMLFKFLNVLLSLLQVPTPITTMKISPKRVSQKNHFTELQPFPGVALVCFKKTM